VQVLHSYGDKNTLAIEQDPDAPPYVARPFVDRMDLAYAAADFALSRGGMMTCSELAAVGLPAAYVPLPIGNGEQRLNARPVVDAGGGLLVDDAALTPAWLAENVIPLLLDEKRLAEMSAAAERFGIRDADDKLVRLVFEAAGAAWPARAETGAEGEAEAEPAVATSASESASESEATAAAGSEADAGRPASVSGSASAPTSTDQENTPR
jgi:UDP-N-acetylglucosamine--N-acetylmuramyl-(pentapeptide) pyrophosphoryl-undecaprenol N-acetylglucosamine transferase